MISVHVSVIVDSNELVLNWLDTYYLPPCNSCRCVGMFERENENSCLMVFPLVVLFLHRIRNERWRYGCFYQHVLIKVTSIDNLQNKSIAITFK